MPRRISSFWIPLLAALLAGPLVQPSSFLWTARARLGRVRLSDTPVKAILPSARLQPALQLRSPIERHGPLGTAPPPDGSARVAFQPVIAAPAGFLSPPLAKSARHFPLFPTGPPLGS